jgi:probable phosphoglycerate mutase
MKRLILVRHGETDWNAENRLQGQQDVPLNEIGIHQADDIARALADESLDVIYTSDLIRASETAARIAARHGLTPVPDVRLRQSAKGRWEGLTWGEIAERYPADLERWRRDQTYLPPGGETTATTWRGCAISSSTFSAPTRIRPLSPCHTGTSVGC